MRPKFEHKDLVVSDRGGVVENRHIIHASVVDATGKLLFAVGDPGRMTLARSAAKPIQALAILETGACDQFGFDDADLALMCASHSSEDRHISRARSMLRKVDVEETDLRCGGHAALSDVVNRAWTKDGFVPTAICNNCSGKHAGMLAGAKALGSDVKDYHMPTHPMQQQVRRIFEELCGPDENILLWGLDGCNLPAPACPLFMLGKMYALLAASSDVVKTDIINQNDSDQTRTSYMDRIFQAMSRYPEYVGGEGRFCTELSKTFQGILIGKLGADGCYGLAIREIYREQARRKEKLILRTRHP
jgi:L-asparaginase II